MKTRKQKRGERKSHDWKKRQAEIKAALDRIDREIELHLKPDISHQKHD